METIHKRSHQQLAHILSKPAASEDEILLHAAEWLGAVFSAWRVCYHQRQGASYDCVQEWRAAGVCSLLGTHLSASLGDRLLHRAVSELSYPEVLGRPLPSSRGAAAEGSAGEPGDSVVVVFAFKPEKAVEGFFSLDFPRPEGGAYWLDAERERMLLLASAILDQQVSLFRAKHALSDSERRMAELNRCLLGFGLDGEANIKRLVALAATLCGADGAVYSRISGSSLTAFCSWCKTPTLDPWGGVSPSFCQEVARQEGDRMTIINQLCAGTQDEIKTCVGQPVRFWEQRVGVLGLVITGHLYPTEGDRQLIGVVCSAIAVEEGRLQAEVELKESEGRHRLLVQNAPLGVLSFDTRGVIQHANPAMLEMLGSPSLEQTQEINFLTFLPLVRSGIAADAQRCLEQGEPIVGERPYISQWGKELYPRYHMVPIRGPHGTVTGVLGLVEDISEQKQAEQEREQLQQQLLQAQKMEAIGLLAGGVAHDINNVLAAIMGMATVMQLELSPGTPGAEEAGGIIDACKKGRDLTRNLLGFARKGKYFSEPLDVNQLIRQTCELLERTLSKKIELQVVLDPALPLVVGDPSQISQALMNLALNAADAIQDQGVITLSTRSVPPPELEDMPAPEGVQLQGTVEVEIADTGCGMDATSLERAFEPFYTTKPAGEGTGLGLAMVYGTAKGHGGSVAIQSEPGQGTTVTLSLPARADLERAVQRPAPLRREGSSPGVRQGLVLLVDDEEMVRYAASKMLHQLGYEVVAAENGQRALEMFRARHQEIAWVILDLIMPVMDGEQTLRAMMADDPHVRVIVASGYSKPGRAEEMLALGALGFLQKPFELEDLAEIIGAKLG